MTYSRSIRPFGVALDASDDPWNVDLKLASIYARQRGMIVPIDPYEALITKLTEGRRFMKPGGKLPLPSWLGPMPDQSDLALVTQERMRKFLDHDGPFRTAQKVKDFVLDRVLPDRPLMLGIDHSTTGGVVSALSQIYGSDMLTVLVLDRHFDAIPLSARMGSHEPGPFRAEPSEERYSCGNFWAYLMEKGIVKPEHLLFIGVADHPEFQESPQPETFRTSYLAYERQGCGFFPLHEFGSSLYKQRLRGFLDEKIQTPCLYVSLDVDVGSYRAVHAARYMDGPGIERSTLMGIGRLIAEWCSSFGHLAGMDVTEFNMHLLGAEIEPGTEDLTAETVIEFINILIDTQGVVEEAEEDNPDRLSGDAHRGNRVVRE